MPNGNTSRDSKLMRAYVDYERKLAIEKCRMACLLGVVFMPAGALLDYFVYSDQVPFFFGLRLWCSVLLGVLWWLFAQPFGQRHHKALGMIEVSLPLFFISLMIYATDGAVSPYYAGLN